MQSFSFFPLPLSALGRLSCRQCSIPRWQKRLKRWFFNQRCCADALCVSGTFGCRVSGSSFGKCTCILCPWMQGTVLLCWLLLLLLEHRQHMLGCAECCLLCRYNVEKFRSARVGMLRVTAPYSVLYLEETRTWHVYI